MVAVKILTAAVAFEDTSGQSKTPEDKRKIDLEIEAILDRGMVCVFAAVRRTDQWFKAAYRNSGNCGSLK